MFVRSYKQGRGNMKNQKDEQGDGGLKMNEPTLWSTQCLDGGLK